MKVKVEIDVTPKEYFDHLCDVMIKDIKKNTNKDVDTKMLVDGYSYKKTISKKKLTANILMTIGPLIPDKYFLVNYETKDTKCLYYYDFSIEDDKNYVTYCEETNYKEENVGTYVGNLRKKFRAKAIEQNAIRNIELTNIYIKNNKK
ncbi:MAG: DUF3284 domain-containing protein [Erysipelotrichia bacterium]|jgi:hypothetical protein|nr:DUF3284 domain-containing protein [Erysipelotrichia bacterium]